MEVIAEAMEILELLLIQIQETLAVMHGVRTLAGLTLLVQELSTCVNTDWRPDTVTPGGPSGGGGHPDCSDGVDNDGDGSTSYPNDPGCTSPTDNSEGDAITGYACSDGIDNDGDGYTDYPSDPGCVTASDTSEFNQFDIYPELPTLDEGEVAPPTDISFEVFTTDEGLQFDG